MIAEPDEVETEDCTPQVSVCFYDDVSALITEHLTTTNRWESRVTILNEGESLSFSRLQQRFARLVENGLLQATSQEALSGQGSSWTYKGSLRDFFSMLVCNQISFSITEVKDTGDTEYYAIVISEIEHWINKGTKFTSPDSKSASGNPTCVYIAIFLLILLICLTLIM